MTDEWQRILQQSQSERMSESDRINVELKEHSALVALMDACTRWKFGYVLHPLTYSASQIHTLTTWQVYFSDGCFLTLSDIVGLNYNALGLRSSLPAPSMSQLQAWIVKIDPALYIPS